MPRQARADAHEALLEAACEEFARRGLERARVADIARRAGVSKGAFYLHFAAKEDAFREIVTRFLGALQDHALRRYELEGGLAAAGGGLPRRIEVECAVDVELLELLWRNRQIVAATQGAAARPYRALVADFRGRMRALVVRRLSGGVCAGERVRGDVPPELIADIVVGAWEDMARRMTELKAKPDLAAWARALLRVLYEGILLRDASPAANGRGARRRPRSALVPDRRVMYKEPR